MISTIKMRRANSKVWSDENPILVPGEFGVEIDTSRFKIGKLNVPWNELGYSESSEGVSIEELSGVFISKEEVSATIGAAVETSAPFVAAKALMPTIAATKVDSLLLHNEASTPDRAEAEVKDLFIGDPAETGPGFAGNTVTHNTDPAFVKNGTGSWKIVSAAGGRIDRNLPSVVGGNVQALCSWVYIEDVTKIASLQFRVTNNSGEGEWLRATNQDGCNVHASGRGLRDGWNFIRFSNIAPNRLNATMTVASIRMTRADTVGDAVWYWDSLWVETPAKAKIMFVNDWGSKRFYLNAYPALKARGYPVVWGVRANYLGTGVDPQDHITLADVKTLMSDGNRNEISFHSWQGNATSGLTAAEQREEVIQTIAKMQVDGYYSDAALFRPAWVQNLAPNAPAAFDMLAASASYTDSYGSTIWPPLTRHGIPRQAYHGGTTTASVDAMFAGIQATRSMQILYTHGVIPTATSNHASQAIFDYVVSKVDAGVADGWLEVVTFRDLVSRYRLDDLNNAMLDTKLRR